MRLCADLIVAILALASAPPLAGEGATAPSSQPVVRIVISPSLFTGINARDAETAIAVWSNVVSKRMETAHEHHFSMKPDLTSCIEAIEAGEADIIGLSGAEYVTHRRELPADPMMVGAWGEEDPGTAEYVLLSGAHDSLADLAGKSLSIGTVDDGATARMWLDILLMREGQPPSGEYLIARSVDRASKALLRSLFGQDDACIVTRRAFETMVELNPQVGRDLTVLATSPGYLSQLACYRRGADPQVREALIRTAEQLHLDPQGRQILDVFRAERAVTCAPDVLDTAEELVAEHGRLLSRFREAERTDVP